MADNQPELLYYPNFDIKDLEGIKRSLFLYDKVNVIAPTATPYMMLKKSIQSDAELFEIDNALSQYPQGVSAGAIGVISDLEIIEQRRDEFMNALDEDLNDPEVKQWAAHHRKRDRAWLVSPTYFGDSQNIDFAKYGIAIVAVPTPSGVLQLLKVPFLVGMSLGLSEALWAAVDRVKTLFTDDPASEEFLMLRLNRGWKHLSQDQELQHTLQIEPEFSKNFAVAQLGTWTLQLKVSEYFEKISHLSIEEIIALREHSDVKEALKEFRSGLADIVTSHDLWEAKSFHEFEYKANKAVEKDIKPAFEVLAKRKGVLSTKDLVTALDVPSGLSQVIKSAPGLFVSAATTTGAVGVASSALVLLGSIHLVPAALLALGCGLGGVYVAQLINQVREQHKEYQEAKFLTYPINVQKALK